ncbi:MAG: GNAT family N-acetyltransferase [Clostridiales bacterium]|nr:GNAT family N-acetyltransferase [Clostridiales bacterium]
MQILPYTPGHATEWNRFVIASRNATFIHHRDYMDYHADRFPDASLMMYDDHSRLIALLPATSHADKTISSHCGLTYGGWLLGESKPTQLQMLQGWKLMIEHYRNMGYHSLLYKPVPHIYHSYPSEEDLYALYTNQATIDMVLASSAIDLTHPLQPNTGTRRHIRRASQLGLVTNISNDYTAFWDILSERLRQRYNAAPVHSLAEITRLSDRFPDNIKLWAISDNRSGNMLAGTVLFLSGRVIKAQYIGSTAAGRAVNATDYLFSLIADHYSKAGFQYLDLGPSNENHGLDINQGLITQKNGYGARTIAYTTYRQPFSIEKN